jgi:hypothetical protein
MTVRKSGSKRWICVLNHNARPKTVVFPSIFRDALSGQSHNGATEIPAYGVWVLQAG